MKILRSNLVKDKKDYAQQLQQQTRLPLNTKHFLNKKVYINTWDIIDKAFVVHGSFGYSASTSMQNALVLFYTLIPAVGSEYKKLIKEKKLFIYRPINNGQTKEFFFCQKEDYKELFSELVVTRRDLTGDRVPNPNKDVETYLAKALRDNDKLQAIIEGGYLLVHRSNELLKDEEINEIFQELVSLGVRIVTVEELLLASVLETEISIYDIEAFLFNLQGDKQISNIDKEEGIKQGIKQGVKELLNYSIKVPGTKYSNIDVLCRKRNESEFDWFIDNQQIRYFVSLNAEILFNTNKTVLIVLTYLLNSSNVRELRGRKAYLTEAFVSEVYVGYSHKALDYHLKRVLGSLDLKVNIFNNMDITLSKAPDSIKGLKSLVDKKIPFLPNKSGKWVSVHSEGLGVSCTPNLHELYSLLDDLMTLSSLEELNFDEQDADISDKYYSILERVLEVYRDNKEDFTDTNNLLTHLALVDRDLLRSFINLLKDKELLAPDQWQTSVCFNPDKFAKLGGRLLFLVPTGGLYYSPAFKKIDGAKDPTVRGFLNKFSSKSN